MLLSAEHISKNFGMRQLLQDASRQRGVTVMIITHNQALTAMADRVIRLKSGKIYAEERNEHIVPIEEIEW